jgi:hypothetical protein
MLKYDWLEGLAAMNSKRPGRNIAVLAVLLGSCIWGASDVFADSIVISYCEETKNFGIASDEREATATEVSLRNCNAFGGRRVEGCCTVVGTTDEGCIAIAVASNGEFGVGKGNTQVKAMSRAVDECPVRGCVVRTAQCSQ